MKADKIQASIKKIE